MVELTLKPRYRTQETTDKIGWKLLEISALALVEDSAQLAEFVLQELLTRDP